MLLFDCFVSNRFQNLEIRKALPSGLPGLCERVQNRGQPLTNERSRVMHVSTDHLYLASHVLTMSDTKVPPTQ